MASASAEELLGIRDAFRRFFHDRLDREPPVAIVGQDTEQARRGIAGSDVEAIAQARSAARQLAERLESHYQFYVASEACIQALSLEGGERFVLRSWTAILGPPGEALGGSGAIELPRALVHGLSGAEIASSIPATRRGGGMLAQLTGGLETRRHAVALATVAALSTLFYGILDGGHGRRP